MLFSYAAAEYMEDKKKRLRATTLERLEAFRAAGGQLIFLGKAPTLMEAIPRSET